MDTPETAYSCHAGKAVVNAESVVQHGQTDSGVLRAENIVYETVADEP